MLIESANMALRQTVPFSAETVKFCTGRAGAGVVVVAGACVVVVVVYEKFKQIRYTIHTCRYKYKTNKEA